MRTEQEIIAMRARLKEMNDVIWEKLKTHPSDSENLMDVFNINGALISALEWVLGHETLNVVDAVGSRLVKGTA